MEGGWLLQELTPQIAPVVTGDGSVLLQAGELGAQVGQCPGASHGSTRKLTFEEVGSPEAGADFSKDEAQNKTSQ